jgi:hypothetical protein
MTCTRVPRDPAEAQYLSHARRGSGIDLNKQNMNPFFNKRAGIRGWVEWNQGTKQSHLARALIVPTSDGSLRLQYVR